MSKQNGSSKGVTSVSLDEDLLNRASRQEHINLSGLCNDLLEEYFNSGSASRARLEAKHDRLLEQKEHLEAELGHVEEELDRVKEQLEQHREEEQAREEKIKDLAEQLPADLDPENPAVMNWAEKLEMTPRELCEEIEEKRGPVTGSRVG
jgi:chromosome segregation ATPase